MRVSMFIGRGNLIQARPEKSDVAQGLIDSKLTDSDYFLLDNSPSTIREIHRRFGNRDPMQIDPNVIELLKRIDYMSKFDVQYHQVPGAMLYPHQVDSVRRILALNYVILADETGLGKSMEAIAALNVLYDKGALQRALFLVPASLKKKWFKECERYAKFRANILDDVADSSDLRKQIYDNPISIISIDLFKRHEASMPLLYDALIVDEIHNAKNWKAIRSRSLGDIDARYKIFLSATPLVNMPDELYTISRTLAPKYLGDRQKFEESFYVGDVIRKPNGRDVVNFSGLKHEELLKRVVATYLIRHAWVDTSLNIESTTENIYLDMLPQQQQIHDYYWNSVKSNNDYFKVWTYLVEVCDSPLLLNDVQQTALMQNQMIDVSQVGMGVKVDYLKSFIPTLRQKHDKIILFTRYEQMVKLLAREFIGQGIITVTGATKDKDSNMTKFWENPNVHLMIADDAMSYGQDLQVADCLINYELPFTPAGYNQRVGRIKRVGQAHHIHIYNLITNNSVEKHVETLVERKEHYHDVLVESPKAIGEALYRRMNPN